MKRVVKGASAAYSLAKAAYRGVQFVRGLVNAEYKNYDLSFSPTTDTTGSVTPLTNVTQGVASTNREGNSCRAKSILCNYTVTKNGAASSTFIRLILFKWNDDTNPTVTTVLDSANINAPMSIANSDKYKIMMDKRIDLDSAVRISYMQKYYRKLNWETKWTAAGNTAYKEGHIWLLAISDQATNTPTVSFYTRFRFIDN